MVKIAFLIIAHTDVEELLRLCAKLKHYGDAYVHVDKKTDNDFMYKLRNGLSSMSGIFSTYIIKDRINVAWAGYSVMDCEDILLEHALKSNANYDRFFFLSGLDYVLYSPKKLQQFCEDNVDKEFLRVYNITESNRHDLLIRIKYYHFFRDIPLPARSFLRRAIIGGGKLLLIALGVRRKPYFFVNGKKWDVYVGSQWVGLTRLCAEFVLDQLKTNTEAIKYFKTTYGPDELIIPTIIMNSYFARKEYLSKNGTFNELAHLHYLNYEWYMHSYDESDFDTLMNSGKLFVRKFVSDKSEKLIELVDNVTRC